MYPYAAGCTTLSSALPRWADRGGSEAIRSLLASPEARRQIRDELAGGQGYIDLGEVVVSAVSPRWQHLRGRSLVTAAAAEGVQPADLLLDILADEGDEATMIVEAMASADVDRVLNHPAAMVGSDGWVLTPDRSAHPRNFATFVRTLQQAAIGEAELAGAVRRQTSAVARRFALEGRGRVTPGCFADLLVVDVAELDEGGGFRRPDPQPRGIERVYVNGAATFDPNGTVSRPGRVLLNPRPRTGVNPWDHLT